MNSLFNKEQLDSITLPLEEEMNYFHGMVYYSDTGERKIYTTNPKGKTTIELIRQGFRTQTTRVGKSWKIGDKIRFTDKGKSKDKNGFVSNTAGQSVLVEITNIYPVTANTFLKYEGWTLEVWENRKETLTNGKYLSYKFKLIK